MVYCFTAFFRFCSVLQKLLQFFPSVLYLLQVIQIFVSVRYYKKKKNCFSFFFLFVSIQSVVLNFFLTNDSVRLQFLFFFFEDCSFEYGITLSVRLCTICRIQFFFFNKRFCIKGLFVLEF